MLTAIKKAAAWVARTFRLDSHHAIERFGVFFSIFAVTGTVVLAGSAVAAARSGSEALAATAQYTTDFTTSRTDINGEVAGIYTNTNRDKALVMMNLGDSSQISYNAADYEAFLLGSATDLSSEPVRTDGIESSFHVFGSTGYVGMLLDAEEPFDRQVLNLTMRANVELAHNEEASQAPATPTGEEDREAGQDSTFDEYDQWQVFFNPGATGAQVIEALDTTEFDPARAYYDVVLAGQEAEARQALDAKLAEMRTDQAQIASYTSDLETTKVDGLFLRPPQVPTELAGDEIVGESAAEAEDGRSTLELRTDHIAPGGFDLNWRSGNVYEGYLDVLVPPGQSYGEYLAAKTEESGRSGTGGTDSGSGSSDDDEGTGVEDMEWILSDGTDLENDYGGSEVTMRSLTNVMNNLSQAYQNYEGNKSEYQSDLMLDLLRLDVDLRDVQSNSSIRDDEELLTVFYPR